MHWFTALALGAFAVASALNTGTISRFSYRSIYDLTFSPCSLNHFRARYKYYVAYGAIHASVIGTLSLLQVLAAEYSPKWSLHLNGSFQFGSLAPTLLYFHLTVNMYKFRYIDIRNRPQMDYVRNGVVDVLCAALYCLIALYAVFLYSSEEYWPPSTYAINGKRRPYEKFELMLYFVVVLAICIAFVELFRICRLCHRINNEIWEVKDDPSYYFRQQISYHNLPYFLNDFFLLFAPVMYLIIRYHPSAVLNVFDILAKFCLIAHTGIFIIIYMRKIWTAKKQSGDQRIHCGCFRCSPKTGKIPDGRIMKRLREIFAFCTCASLRENRRNGRQNGGRNGGQNGEQGEGRREENGFEMQEIGGAATAPTEMAALTTEEENAREQPTETTPIDPTHESVSEAI